MEEKINILPYNNGTDSATAMAMMNNNPWMYLVMLALFGNGGFGNNRNGQDYVALSNQINDNNNNQYVREAIQGSTFAISQLSQNLGVDYNALTQAVGTVNMAISNLGAQTGMGFAGVTNAINLGNLNLVQQLKDCCCNMQTQVLNQGYQNQIQTINQTNDLQTAVRVENGLTRTEVAAFRQAWENSRYQDVVAEKTRLQTELDLLRQSQGTAAAINASIAPLTTKIQQIEYTLQSVYGTKTTTTSGQ